jgi:hypothetical protein
MIDKQYEFRDEIIKQATALGERGVSLFEAYEKLKEYGEQ